MIFNYTPGGGGGGLNYDVKGGTEEPAAKENRIWVSTEIPITGHTFSAANPSGAPSSDGWVWFTIGTSSNCAFSATKKNPIMIYPKACWQYSNNKWTNIINVKTYINSSWIDWIDIVYDITNIENDPDRLAAFQNSFGIMAKLLYEPEYNSEGTQTIGETNYTLLSDGTVQIYSENDGLGYYNQNRCGQIYLPKGAESDPSKKLNTTGKSKIEIEYSKAKITGGRTYFILTKNINPSYKTQGVIKPCYPLQEDDIIAQITFKTGFVIESTGCTTGSEGTITSTNGDGSSGIITLKNKDGDIFSDDYYLIIDLRTAGNSQSSITSTIRIEKITIY